MLKNKISKWHETANTVLAPDSSTDPRDQPNGLKNLVILEPYTMTNKLGQFMK